MRIPRPLAVAATTLIAGSLALAGCSNSGSGTDSKPAEKETSPAATASQEPAESTFPVTIEHALGTTEIKEKPQRIATISWMNDDIVLALGVVPVGVPALSRGGNENQSSPWKDAKLEELGAAWGTDKAPAQYDSKPGTLPLEEIAATNPDLIIATYSGIKPEEYEQLTKIAPTIAYPEHPYATTWQEATRQIGKALGLDAKAEELIKATEAEFQKVKDANPELAGKTFIAARLDPEDTKIGLYTSKDNRAAYFEQLGMKMAPAAEEATKDSEDFAVMYPPEQADQLETDVLVTWVFAEKMADGIKANPLLAKIPAVANDTAILSADPLLAMSTAGASPLSIPWANEHYVPMIKEALAK